MRYPDLSNAYSLKFSAPPKANIDLTIHAPLGVLSECGQVGFGGSEGVAEDMAAVVAVVAVLTVLKQGEGLGYRSWGR